MSRPPSQSPSWLAESATTVAPLLLGWRLTTVFGRHITSGRIVETEAYMGRQDPASHGYRTATPRTQSMFQNAGTIYVYFTYGVHYCVNIVTGAPLDPQAVLIRALEPTEGINIMSERRGLTDRHRLCRGPGNLTKALAIDGTMNGTHIGEFIKLDPPIVTSIGETIAQSPRIGVTKAADRPWRYYISGSKFVSGPVYPNT